MKQVFLRLKRKMKLQKFYKLARPNGFDFHTGETINYRGAIGKTVRAPNFNAGGELCSDAFLHASRKPNQCFAGASIPCSAFVVRGTPILEDDRKAGFESLYIEKEVDPASIFKWNYNAATNPINPFSVRPPKIAQQHILLLRGWATVGATVRDTVWATVRDTVWATIWDTVWTYAGSLFVPVVKQWKTQYPFQDAVDLWYDGLVPSFDGETWRLHGGEHAKILYEEKI